MADNSNNKNKKEKKHWFKDLKVELKKVTELLLTNFFRPSTPFEFNVSKAKSKINTKTATINTIAITVAVFLANCAGVNQVTFFHSLTSRICFIIISANTA